MPRRSSAPTLAALAALAAAAPGPPAAAAAATRPNIVLVLADDLDARSTSLMPTVQDLARRGATFTNAFSVTPMCAPARASLLTGKYPQNTTVRSNRTPSGGYPNFLASGQEADTWAVWLRRAGYRTALVGKYMNEFPGPASPLRIPAGWSRWVSAMNDGDMHAKYEYVLNEDGVTVAYGNAVADYSIDVYAGKARAFVREAADAGEPFALFLSVPSPHVKEVPAPRHSQLFPSLRAPRLASFPETDVGDKPPFLRYAPLDAAAVQTIDERYRKRARMLQSVDEALGSIRALLAERGLLERTYLVFTSDQGWHQGEHNEVPGKGRAYDEDLRVPLVVAGPGVPAGRRVDRLVGSADLAPTFAAWAGIAPGPAVDGRSFARLLAAPDPAQVPWRKRLPFMRAIEGTQAARTWPVFGRVEGSPEGYTCLEGLPPSGTRWPEFRGVRTERYSYTEYVTGDRELYDMSYDPRQLVNRICRAPAALLDRLNAVAVALSTCDRWACRRAEDWP